MTISLERIPCLKDNFAVLLHDSASGKTALIDAPDFAPVEAVLKSHGWPLDAIFITHKHSDHVQAIAAFKQAYPAAKIYGPAIEKDKIPHLEIALADGDSLPFGTLSARILSTPGHTLGHICYYFAQQKLLFAGDTLFALGCGRVLETALEVMYASLQKLKALPNDTWLYDGHNYLASNFAFACSVEPENEDLIARGAAIHDATQNGILPAVLTFADELKTNPFLRTQSLAIQTTLGMVGADDAAVFSKLRLLKNGF